MRELGQRGSVKSQAELISRSLRKAVSCLIRAHSAYTKVRYGPLTSESDDDDDLADSGIMAMQLPRHLERLQIVRRSLEDVIDLAATSGEDELVQTSLQQHEMAMQAREQAESLYVCEERHVGKLRNDIIEMQRSIQREERVQERLGIASGTERERALQRQSAAMEVEKQDLHSEAQNIAEALSDSVMRNRQIKVSISEVDQALSVAAAENLKALRALGIHNSESYKKAKDRERAVANLDLMTSTARCQQQMAELHNDWSQQEARYHAEMQELHAEVQSLHRLHEEKQTQAEDLLTKQSSAWTKTGVDTDTKINRDIATLDALCMQKASAVHRATLISRERIKESAAGTQRRMEHQVREVNLTCKTRLKLEEIKFGNAIIKECKEVEDAKQEAEWWAKRANRTRENYKAHAIKSGAYIKQLEPQFRQEIVRLCKA